jgi:hypothetical protein
MRMSRLGHPEELVRISWESTQKVTVRGVGELPSPDFFSKYSWSLEVGPFEFSWFSGLNP